MAASGLSPLSAPQAPWRPLGLVESLTVLLAVDGLSIVQSRFALLDIFLALFVVAGFGLVAAPSGAAPVPKAKVFTVSSPTCSAVT